MESSIYITKKLTKNILRTKLHLFLVFDTRLKSNENPVISTVIKASLIHIESSN